MAVGNFVMSDVTSVMEIVSIVRHYVYVGRAWCHIVIFLSTFSFTQSMLFITLMAVIRIWSGLSTHRTALSTKKVVVFISIVYVLSIIWGAMWSLPDTGDLNGGSCFETRGQSITFVFLPYFIMTSVLFIATVCSYVTLIVWMCCKNTMAGNRKSEILTLKAAVAVTVLFTVSYLIPLIDNFVYLDLPANGSASVLHTFVCLGYVQSALNPYIYLATNSHFREIYKATCCKVLSCCTQRPRAVSDSSNTNNTTSSNITSVEQEQ